MISAVKISHYAISQQSRAGRAERAAQSEQNKVYCQEKNGDCKKLVSCLILMPNDKVAISESNSVQFRLDQYQYQ